MSTQTNLQAQPNLQVQPQPNLQAQPQALTNRNFDSAITNLTTQHGSLRMRLDNNDNLTDSAAFYEMHDNETYNVDNIKQSDLLISSQMFNDTGMNREKNFLTHNFVKEHRNSINERYDNALDESNRIKTNLEKSRIQVQNAENTKLIYIYYIRIVLVSFFFFSIISFLLLSISAYLVEDKHKEYHMWIYVSAVVVTILYLTILYLYYRETWRRRNDEFSKIDFRPPKT